MANAELSEFFSLVSQEKNQNRTRLKKRIENPKSDLGSLFKELENAHKETKNVSEEFIEEISEELSEEKILTEDDQNKLEVFSSLVDSLNTPIEPTVETVELEHTIEPEEPVDDTEKITAFEELFKKFAEPTPKPKPKPIVEITPVPEVKEEKIPQIYSQAIADPVELLAGKTVERTGNIIQDIVTSLDDMGERTEVKEEIDQITALRGEFDKFKTVIQRHISNQDHSGAGSGEVRLEFLDDVQSSTAKVDEKFLQYSSSDGKWVGADASGGSSAADDISAGDAAINITTTSGNITIDAAANNSDIIFKGTDATSDITMLTLDGSAAGAAIFNSTITATGITIGSTAVSSTAAELNILDGVTSTAAEINLLDGITAGTASASKAVILDSNKDLTGVRNLTVAGDLVVSGTTKTVDTVTMEAANAVIFEGATADGNETTLTIVDPTADHTQYLINQTGYIPVLAASTTTAITSTPAELNLVDGSSANSVVNSKAVIYGSSGEVAGTLSTAAQSNITSVGTLTTLTVDNIIINGTNIGHTSDTDSIAIASDGVVTFSQAPVFPDGSIAVVDLDIDGATDIGAAIVDADLFVIDDGAGGTNRKTTASRIATYVGASAGAFSIANLDIDGGTDINAALTSSDLIIVDDGAGGTNRKAPLSRVTTLTDASATALAIALG